MDLQRMLTELREEQKQIDAAIGVLQKLAAGQTRKRGRPPKWMAAIGEMEVSEAPSTPSPRRRRAISAESRARMAEAQRRRWAAARGEKGAE
jgi:hypothetical protein